MHVPSLLASMQSSGLRPTKHASISLPCIYAYTCKHVLTLIRTHTFYVRAQVSLFRASLQSSRIRPTTHISLSSPHKTYTPAWKSSWASRLPCKFTSEESKGILKGNLFLNLHLKLVCSLRSSPSIPSIEAGLSNRESTKRM